MPTATDLVTDLPADFEVFGQAVATSMADLLGGTSGQILAKNSNTDMDFVWIANDQGDITAVTAGTGISGGGTSGAVTITNSMATEITAKGDLIAGTGSATFDNLPVGTNGQTLVADSSTATGLKWATASAAAFKGASCYNSANLTIGNATWTSVALNSELFDTDAFHSTSVNNTRFTIPAGLGGYYLVTANMGWQANAVGIRIIRVIKNGTTVYFAPQVVPSGTVLIGCQMSLTIAAAASDYLEFQIYQSSGGNLDTTGSSTDAAYQVTYLGA